MEHTLLCVGKTNEMASTTPITLTATESKDVKAHVQIQLENKVNKCQSCNKVNACAEFLNAQLYKFFVLIMFKLLQVYSSQALLSKHEKIHDPARWKKCPHCKHVYSIFYYYNFLAVTYLTILENTLCMDIAPSYWETSLWRKRLNKILILMFSWGWTGSSSLTVIPNTIFSLYFTLIKNSRLLNLMALIHLK